MEPGTVGPEASAVLQLWAEKWPRDGGMKLTACNPWMISRTRASSEQVKNTLVTPQEWRIVCLDLRYGKEG